MTKGIQRVMRAIEIKGLKPSVVEKQLGLSNGYLATMSRRNGNLGEDIILKICEYFDFSLSYLLIGEELSLENSLTQEPLTSYANEITNAPLGKTKKKNGSELIPYYDIDFLAGNNLFLNDDFTNQNPQYYMDIPEFYGCSAFRTYSDSMERIIKSGTILFGKKVDNWSEHIEYGQIYGIVCLDGRKYLKYIKKSAENKETHLTFVSENNFYDDFEMSKKNIRSVWLIHGWLNKNI